MRPVKLILSGWGPYPGVEVVDFETLNGGLFLVTGPTGAGKTSIFDGIAFALYGEVSGSVREKDSLRSDFAKPETATSVELTYTHLGKTYRVVRNPKYVRLKLRGEGLTSEAETGELYEGDNLIAVGSVPVTEAVKSLLGLDCHQFKQISMIAQGEFQQLLTASSRKRTEVFRDIFQTRLYDIFTGVLNSRVKQIAAKVEEKKHRAEEITSAIQIESGEWKALLETKNRNYEKIIGAVELEIEDLRQARSDMEEELAGKDRYYKNALSQIERYKQFNQQLAQYERDLRRLEELRSEKEELTAVNREWKKAYDGLYKVSEELEAGRETLRRLQGRQKVMEQWLSLMERLKGKQKVYLELDIMAKERKLEYEYQDDCYRKAAAGILAGGLVKGQPCPVCGSNDHPSPAQVKEELPDENRLRKLKQEYETAWKKASDAQAEAASLAGMVRTLEAQTGQDGIMGRGTATEESPGHLRSADYLEDGQLLLDDLVRQIHITEQTVRDLDSRIREVTEGYQNSRLRLEKVKASCAQMKEYTHPPKDKEPKDVTALSGELKRLEQERRRLNHEKEQAAGRLMNHHKALGILRKHLSEKEQLEREYGVVREVERAASGYNNRNLMFEQYVLSVYFDDILRAANRRLLTMTGDRYELYRLPESKDRRTKEGMELEVFDQYTGKRRSVRTLSGGETFKAALALALGTSDVVQAYAGGIQVETLFVDEGFGSLDGESLNQAIGILTSLGDSSRMIGIISHVEELKERIDNQIVIEKTAHGSFIRMNH